MSDNCNNQRWVQILGCRIHPGVDVMNQYIHNKVWQENLRRGKVKRAECLECVETYEHFIYRIYFDKPFKFQRQDIVEILMSELNGVELVNNVGFVPPYFQPFLVRWKKDLQQLRRQAFSQSNEMPYKQRYQCHLSELDVDITIQSAKQFNESDGAHFGDSNDFLRRSIHSGIWGNSNDSARFRRMVTHESSIQYNNQLQQLGQDIEKAPKRNYAYFSDNPNAMKDFKFLTGQLLLHTNSFIVPISNQRFIPGNYDFQSADLAYGCQFALMHWDPDQRMEFRQFIKLYQLLHQDRPDVQVICIIHNLGHIFNALGTEDPDGIRRISQCDADFLARNFNIMDLDGDGTEQGEMALRTKHIRTPNDVIKFSSDVEEDNDDEKEKQTNKRKITDSDESNASEESENSFEDSKENLSGPEWYEYCKIKKRVATNKNITLSSEQWDKFWRMEKMENEFLKRKDMEENMKQKDNYTDTCKNKLVITDDDLSDITDDECSDAKKPVDSDDNRVGANDGPAQPDAFESTEV